MWILYCDFRKFKVFCSILQELLKVALSLSTATVRQGQLEWVHTTFEIHQKNYQNILPWFSLDFIMILKEDLQIKDVL